MLSKAEQLKKSRQKKPSRMTDIEKRSYIDFIREKCKGVCQIPWCDNPAQDFAHKDRAYKRDDRYCALLCRSCHQKADQPNPKQIDESSKINLALSSAAKQNWRDYTV